MFILSDNILAKLSIPTRNAYLDDYRDMMREEGEEHEGMIRREEMRQATRYADAVERIESSRYRAA